MDDRLREFEPMLQAIAGRYFAPGVDHEDLLQEARIGAWAGLRDFRPGQGASLRTFVSFCAERMVQTAVIAARRRKHEHLNDAASLDAPVREDGDNLGDLLGSDADPLAQISLRDELRSIVDRLNDVELLTEVERAAIVGIELEGRSYDEIREPLRASRKQIDNAVQRARRKLREPAPAPDTRRRLAPSPPRRRPPCPPRRKEPRRMTALEAVRAEITEAQEEREVLLDRAEQAAGKLEKLREAEQLLASLDSQTTPPPVVEKPKSKPAKAAKPRPKSKPAPSRAVKVNGRQVTDPVPDVETPPRGSAPKTEGRTYKPKPCKGCGEDFTPTGPRHLYCGNCAVKPPAKKASNFRLPAAKETGEEIAAPDQNGARTDIERKVLGVLNGSGLTTNEATKNLDGLNATTVGSILAALARRGVVERREGSAGISIWSRAEA